MAQIILEYALTRMDRAVTRKDTGRHAHYDRVTSLAREYTALATGMATDDLFLVMFDRRENPAQFEQRKRITVPKTGSLLSPAIMQFTKTSRLQNIRRDLTYDSRADHDVLKLVRESMENFYGEGGVEEWIATGYDWLSLIDPNAYVVTEFERNPATGKIEPYPVPYFASQVYEAGRNKRNQLQYLLVQNDPQEPKEYFLYGGAFTLHYSLLPDKDKDPTGYQTMMAQKNIYEKDPLFQPKDEAGKVTGPAYLRQYYETKCPFVQAERLGYLPDPATGFLTCVSALEPAKQVLIDYVRTSSNFDLTKYLHVMPQKTVVQPACPAMGCTGGEMPDGASCATCKGTGLAPIHTQPDDTVVVPMPNKLADLPDLSRFIHYVQVDLQTFGALDQNLKDLASQVYIAIFNNETVQTQTVTPVATATQFATQRDNINNTLTPFAEHKASIYRFLVRCQAVFVSDDKTFDLNKLGVVYEVPKNLQATSVEELYAVLQAALSASAPSFEIEQIIKDLGEQRYEGDADALARFRVRISHLPFMGLSFAQLQYYIASGYIRKRDIVLIAYQDSVFADLERVTPRFYAMKYDEREKLIIDYVKAIIAELPDAQLPTLNMGKVLPLPTGLEQPVPIDQPAPAPVAVA